MWIRLLLGVALANSIACAAACRSPQGGLLIAPLDAPTVLDSLRDRYTILQDSLDATRRHLDQAIPDPRRTIGLLDSLALAVEAMVDSLRSTDNAIALALVDSVVARLAHLPRCPMPVAELVPADSTTPRFRMSPPTPVAMPTVRSGCRNTLDRPRMARP